MSNDPRWKLQTLRLNSVDSWSAFDTPMNCFLGCRQSTQCQLKQTGNSASVALPPPSTKTAPSANDVLFKAATVLIKQ